MCQIRVCGLKEIDVHKNWATHVISLVDDMSFAPSFEIPQHIEIFGDVEEHDQHLFNLPLASKKQIENVKNFVESLPKDARLLIHCHGGIGRSAAMAIGILCLHGFKPFDAINTIHRIRPKMWPNERVLKLWGILLNNKKDILDEIHNWQEKELLKGLEIP